MGKKTPEKSDVRRLEAFVVGTRGFGEGTLEQRRGEKRKTATTATAKVKDYFIEEKRIQEY